MNELSPTSRPDSRPAARTIVLAVLVAALLTGGGFAVGRATAPASAARSAPPAPTGCSPTPTAMSMNSPDASLSQMIGRDAGTALAGHAPLTVNDTQLLALGNQTPSNATVDACANRITFSTATVALVVEAVPPNNPDMTFRIAGLVDPAVVVPRGARVDIEFVNGDTDQAHAFVITGAQPPFAFRPAAPPAFAGAAVDPVGDPTAAGHGARETVFTAGVSGAYEYLCPMPGHAEMGMHGSFIVSSTGI